MSIKQKGLYKSLKAALNSLELRVKDQRGAIKRLPSILRNAVCRFLVPLNYTYIGKRCFIAVFQRKKNRSQYVLILKPLVRKIDIRSILDISIVESIIKIKNGADLNSLSIVTDNSDEQGRVLTKDIYQTVI